MSSCDTPAGALMRAIDANDLAAVRGLLAEGSALRPRINQPIGPFDSPPLNSAKSREMVDLLLDAGADLNARSTWWAGGFAPTHVLDLELARYLVERGATVDIHTAARLGDRDRLRSLLSAEPGLVSTRAGDGQTPLHFAADVETARILLEAGAEIDARDIDHESTAAQWMAGDRAEVARFLVDQGCETDILLACAVGDRARVAELLDANPDRIHVRANDAWYPKKNPRAGGTIYFWSLGANASPYQAAARNGHQAVLELLLERSEPYDKLLAACWLHDSALVKKLLADSPDLVTKADSRNHRELVQAATRNDTEAVRLMLEAGLPADARGQHNGTALHWAGFHGNLAMVQLLLPCKLDLNDTNNDFRSPPLGWAQHGSEHGWYRDTGAYDRVVEALIAAGAPVPSEAGGSAAVRAVLEKHGARPMAPPAAAGDS